MPPPTIAHDFTGRNQTQFSPTPKVEFWQIRDNPYLDRSCPISFFSVALLQVRFRFHAHSRHPIEPARRRRSDHAGVAVADGPGSRSPCPAATAGGGAAPG